jgi:hypothetical protein
MRSRLRVVAPDLTSFTTFLFLFCTLLYCIVTDPQLDINNVEENWGKKVAAPRFDRGPGTSG